MRRALALLPLVACQTPLVCRAPDVWVTNAEGVEDGIVAEVDAGTPFALSVE